MTILSNTIRTEVRVVRASLATLRQGVILLLILLLIIAVNECYGADSTQSDTRGLFSLLPEQTAAAVLTTDFTQAVAINFAADPGNHIQWWGDFSKTFGLSPQKLGNITSGALLRAEIRVGGSWEEVVLARVNSKQAHALLDRYHQEHQQIAEVLEVGAGSFHAYRFSGKGTSSRVVQGVFQDHLILATNIAAAQTIVERLKSNDAEVLLVGWDNLSLDNKGDSKDALQLTWFAMPWLKGEIQARQDKKSKSSSKLKNAQRHGLTAIKSIGGVVKYGDGVPVAARANVYAPRPWSATLKMFESLQPDPNLCIPAWVPKDMDHVELVSMDLPQAFQHIDALFDDFYADGIVGTYRETLQDIRIELEVDLEKDIYTNWGQRICMLHVSPKDAPHPSVLYAIETKSPEIAGKAIRQLMQDDPEVKQVAVEGFSKPMWHVLPIEPGGEDFVFMVAKKYVFFSNDAKLMHQVLTSDNDDTLIQDKEVQEIYQAILSEEQQLPSLIVVRGEENSAEASEPPPPPQPPLNLLFAGPKTLDAWSNEQSTDVLSTMFPRRDEFRVSVVFSEENGWHIHSRALLTQKKETIKSHE